MNNTLKKVATHELSITPAKTRQELCDEYGITYKVFKRKLQFYGIELPPGIIMPKYLKMIYDAFGTPPSLLSQ